MTGVVASWRPGRVLMSLLPDADGRTALAEAARVARLLGSQLACVFLEEADLFALASLPHSVEIGRISGQQRPLDSGTLVAESSRRLAIIRREFAALSEAAGQEMRGEVEVLRGHVLDPIRRAQPDDLVFYAASPQRLAERELLGALREAARHTAGILLQHGGQPAPSGPVVAVVGSLAGAARAWPILQQLAGGSGERVEIFLAGPPARLAASGIAGSLPAHRLKVLEASAPLSEAAALAARSGAALLVGELGEDSPGQAADLRAALRRLRCPLLLTNFGEGS